MSEALLVNRKTFQYPSVNQEPGWGDDATKWAKEVTTVLGSLAGTNDILKTSFTVNNNISSVADITGLLFNTSTVRTAEIKYSIYRTTNSVHLAEGGTILIVYDSVAGSWNLTQMSNGNAGVSFSITNGGQMQYLSSNISGSSYSGKINFTASTLLV